MQGLIFENKNENTYFINVLRIIACFAVIIIHIHINFSKDLSELLSSTSANVMSVNYRFMSFAVPMFLTITGYIFLGYKKECTYKSIFKYLIRFILIWVILGVVLNIGEYTYIAHSFDIAFIKKGIVQVIAGDTWDHLWYIKMVFFIYLILPVLKPFFAKENNEVIIFFILFLLEIFIIPIYNSFSPVKIYTHFVLENYVFYVVLGAVLYRYKLNDSKIANVIYILLIILIIYLNSLKRNPLYAFGNLFDFGTFMLVVLLFTICRNIFNIENKLVSYISSYTLDIYIYHVIFLHIITKLFKYEFLIKENALLGVYVLAIFIFVGTLLFSICLRQLKMAFTNFIYKRKNK